MSNAAPHTIYLRDYAPPPFLVERIDMDIDLRDDHAHVAAKMLITRNPASTDTTAALVLDGDSLELLSVAIDGHALAADAYQLSATQLVIINPPACFTLDTAVRIQPDQNTQLMGLYRSKDGYFTQCEAEGFRRITFFLDRPDVMARYTTTVHAERARLPVLLSNGNLVASGDEANGRHFARWEDPFPKPSYLFAMVAAKLEHIERDLNTASGRPVKLMVYVEPGQLDQCGFALDALEASMRWDEQTFGLELDLDRYMIVAVGDFNMGAMENKGLNIFNTRYVLARPDTATDTDYMMLDRVVAHEYFHNWTGNRVTCRDWFQLSLKEGLTVFRDQQYGGDRYSHAVQRIQEVRGLRASQFPEDAGPMAHPVRPSAYMEISNFYTATVYNKGAEVVRMIHTLLGAEGFRRGMDLYFERHDGQAVCTEDFVAAMADAGSVDLGQFQRWYEQAGTPRVTVAASHDPAARTYTLDFTQSCPPSAGQPDKLPFHIPVSVGLLNQQGVELPLRLTGETDVGGHSRVLSLTEASQRFVFEDVAEAVVPSLLRGFSAPVELAFDYPDHALAVLAAHDSDPFNRWEAGQRLAMRVIVQAVAAIRAGHAPEYGEAIINAGRRVLADASRDPAFAAEALSLPGAAYIAEQLEEVDPEAIFAARMGLRRVLATQLQTEFEAALATYTTSGPYSPDPLSAGRRALRNLALGYLMELETPDIRERCLKQLREADNMTDSMAALLALANCDCPEREAGLEWFYTRWQAEPLVVDKWFSAQASSRLPGTLAEVKRLLTHPAFDLRNPNKVRALIGAFCHGNHVGFNAADGRGYAFAAEQIIALDGMNAQVAARMARAFDRWRKFDAGRQQHARTALERIRATDGLSKDSFEVVSRALA